MQPGPDLRERNLGAIFDVILDTDRDGIIAASDFEQLAQGVCDHLGVPDGPQAAAVHSAYRAWWQQLSSACDSDGNGQVTRAEFTTAHLTGHGDPEAYYQQQLSALFEIVTDAMDIDGDGFIGQAEYVRLFRLADVSEEVVLAGFQRLDQDRDGRISTHEFRAGAAHAFLSPDSADPGTAMLGLA
jgi:Ca2+-binding EF-hand superfamily protein